MKAMVETGETARDISESLGYEVVTMGSHCSPQQPSHPHDELGIAVRTVYSTQDLGDDSEVATAAADFPHCEVVIVFFLTD